EKYLLLVFQDFAVIQSPGHVHQAIDVDPLRPCQPVQPAAGTLGAPLRRHTPHTHSLLPFQVKTTGDCILSLLFCAQVEDAEQQRFVSSEKPQYAPVKLYGLTHFFHPCSNQRSLILRLSLERAPAATMGRINPILSENLH